MKKTIILLVVVVIAAAVVARVYGPGWLHPGDANRLAISGNIELTQVDISFKVPGKLVELNVDEGAFVKKGTVIARIDRQQVDKQRSRDEAGLTGAQVQLQETATLVQWQRATLESDIALRRAELRAAQAHLDELLAGSRTQEIQQALAAVSEAKAQHDAAKLDWDRAQELFKNDDISRAQYDQYRMRNDSSAAALKQAEERLAMVSEGPRKEEIESARAQVARAEAAVRVSEANRLELKRKEEDLGARRAEVSRAQAQIGITDTQINDTVVAAPIDGVVLVKSAEVGEVLAAGTTVVTIGDVDHPWLRGYINETDLGRLKLGAPATLTSDSYKGKQYNGHVSFISSSAEFTPKQIQTKEERVKLVYRIKIDVENPQRDLKSNMPVDAEIPLT
ncbi:MAG TPA: HlyD family efflux transporter periplasmic adaptor subunit [Bryobacteraceae bacterium]|nr:HlyD family efflux transporter periplasmic adaptor subunit [Bryobacteraceae bacterium]